MQNRLTKILTFIASMLVVFVMFFVVAHHKAAAQGVPQTGDSCGENGAGTIVNNPETGPICVMPSGGQPTPAATSTSQKEAEFGCGFTSWAGLKGCGAAIAYGVMSFFAIFLGIAGFLLNVAIEITVKNMSSFVNGSDGTVTAIETAWKLFRDIGNIIILFVLLFSAIGTILRTDKIVSRGMLSKVIIAAFLINFSLFYTKIIIDISNVFTFTIHNEIKRISATNNDPLQMGVAGAFMNGLNPMTIYKGLQDELVKNPAAAVESHIFQQMILGSIVMLIAAFVFLLMAMMLFIRFTILMFLLVTSPVGIVGGLIPKLQTYSKQWWDTLIGQAMFAPVLLLFMLITILLINKRDFITALNSRVTIDATSQTARALGFFASDIPMLIQYVIVITLLIMGVVVAKSVAGSFGSGAVKWASQKAGSFAFGGAAWAGRQTFGRAGEGLASSARVGRMLESNNLLYRGFGKGLSLAGNKMKSSSMDVRGAGAAGGALAGTLGAGVAGGKGGIVGEREARQKRITERAEKYAVNRGVATQEAKVEEARKKYELAQRTYNSGPGTQTDRVAMLKAKSELETAKSGLVEMKGGASKAREAYIKATEQLTIEERKEAETHKKVIETQEELIKAMKERLKINPNDQDAQNKLAQLETNLQSYKIRFISTNTNFQNYLDAQKQYESAKKAASDMVGQAKREVGLEYSDAIFQARRAAGNEFLKGKEKPEDSLLKAFKEMMSSGSNQQQTPQPATPTTTPPTTPTNNTPREGREL